MVKEAIAINQMNRITVLKVSIAKAKENVKIAFQMETVVRNC